MSKGSKPKKKKGETINVYDSTAVKASLDAYVCKVLETKKSLSLDQTLSNIRIVVTFLAVSMAVIAQFYPAKFPDNWNALIICCPVFFILNSIITYVLPIYEQDIVCVTRQSERSRTPSLILRSSFDELSGKYTLSAEIKGKNSKSSSTTSIGEFFNTDGYLNGERVQQTVNSVVNKAKKSD